jgi:hypothetical protein
VKTFIDWQASRLPFSQFAAPGDQVDADTFDYFLGVVPPALTTVRVLCVGEPFDHNGAGKPRFMTFVRDGARVEYEGVRSVEDARRL